MTSLVFKIAGVGLFGIAMVLAISIHSPVGDSTGQTQGSGELKGRAQRSEDALAPRFLDSPKRSLASRKTDHSMATRLRNRKILVSIGGQVRQPGSILLPVGCTLSSAVREAGGVTEFGAITRTKVYRSGELMTYDLTNQEFQNVIIEAGDTVEIPMKYLTSR